MEMRWKTGRGEDRAREGVMREDRAGEGKGEREVWQPGSGGPRWG